MIKTYMGKAEMQGSCSVLLADLTTACGAVKDVLIENGISEDEAKKQIKKSVQIALMTDEEVEEHLGKLFVEKLLKGLV